MNVKGDLNRSVRNTKKRLGESLLELIQEKHLSQISVKELTDKADLNRSTFYFHYQDVNAMMREMEDRFFKDFSAALETLDREPQDFMLVLVHCVSEHMDLCRILLSENSDMVFMERMSRIVAHKCTEISRQFVPGLEEKDRAFLDSFLIGGVLLTIRTWVMEEVKDSEEHVASILNRLIFEGVQPVVAQWR